jgi:hypothetical protein
MEWEWVGEVHEYVHRKDGKWVPQQTIEGLWFNHDATGGQGGKRFTRDEAILLKVGSTPSTIDRLFSTAARLLQRNLIML